MAAALRLNWYKFRNNVTDFIKILVGILIFEGLILYIQDKGFFKDFETTRMTLFLLLFSSSLLIMVQNSIYISKERDILDRDFFSYLSRWGFSVALLFFNTVFAFIETLFFCIGFYFFANYFDKDLPSEGQVFDQYWLEIGVTVLLVFLCSHFIALLISALTGKSEITSVILAVMLGIMQFSLSGTILHLPKAIKEVTKFIFLGYGHKVFGMTNKLENLPSAMATFNVPIPKVQLEQFEASKSVIIKDWYLLGIHVIGYALIFILILNYKRSRK